MAENLDDPAILSAALGALSSVYGGRGRFRERVEVSLRRLELSRDPRFGDEYERVNALLDTGRALVRIGEYARAVDFLVEAESLASQIQAVKQQVMALRYQAQSWYQLDRWAEVLVLEEKRRDLEERYANFLERSGPVCFHIALSASVHALQGDTEKALALRDESKMIMTAVEGPPEMWGRSNHY
jgi:hypothetical protein